MRMTTSVCTANHETKPTAANSNTKNTFVIIYIFCRSPETNQEVILDKNTLSWNYGTKQHGINCLQEVTVTWQ